VLKIQNIRALKNYFENYNIETSEIFVLKLLNILENFGINS